MGLRKQLWDPCARADLGCVCTPKLGCLYCLLGSHPSRSVSLCLDIKGKNWRTGSKLESLYRQGSWSFCCCWTFLQSLSSKRCVEEQYHLPLFLSWTKRIFFFNSYIPSGRSVVWSSLACGPREVTNYRALCVSACSPGKAARWARGRPSKGAFGRAPESLVSVPLTYLFYHSFPVKVATLIPEDLQLP